MNSTCAAQDRFPGDSETVASVWLNGWAQSRMGMPDNYEILGISPSASADLIKAAYRKKAAQYHPDKNQSPDAPRLFRAAQEAYEVLADAARRKAYDDYRQRNLIEDPLSVASDMAGQYIQDALK
jgi:DnaJ-class molecular chaperone